VTLRRIEGDTKMNIRRMKALKVLGNVLSVTFFQLCLVASTKKGMSRRRGGEMERIIKRRNGEELIEFKVRKRERERERRLGNTTTRHT
jgi:hypothetical protein